MTTQVRSLLARVLPSGVILFGRNITTAEQTFRLLQECREIVSTPMFTAVDLEGGLVDRFRKVIGPCTFSCGGICHGRSPGFPQAWTVDWRQLPRFGIQY